MATLDINIRQANADFQAIKSAIINSGVVVDDGTKTSEYASKINGVYEAGRNSGIGEMWDSFQDYGNRDAYNAAFAYWDCEYIRPKYKVSPKEASSTIQTFFNNKGLKRVEKEYFDFSNCDRATYPSGSWYYMFCSCPYLEVIEDIGITNVYNFGNTFAWCGALHTIECIYPDVDTQFDGAFIGCYELVYLRVDGTIGQNGFDISWSTKLSKESITSIVNALSTTASGKSITLSKAAVNQAFETYAGVRDGSVSSEWLALADTRSNWTIALA